MPTPARSGTSLVAAVSRRPASLAIRLLLIAVAAGYVGSACVSGRGDKDPGLRGEVEITTAAKFKSTYQDITCPPLCVDGEGPEVGGEDPVHPITFTVCKAPRECTSVVAGSTATVPSNATIRAPDGVSHKEQLPAFEEDARLRFVGWSDGVTDNPRPVVVPGVRPLGNPIYEILAIYSLATLTDPSKAAAKAGCPLTDTLLFATGRQWVERGPGFVSIQGPATVAYLAHEDFFQTHDSQDFVVWVLLDGEWPAKLLSRPADGSRYGHRPNQIQTEWEVDSHPKWVRPWAETWAPDEKGIPKIEDSDLVWMRGKWVFDCGHSDNDIDEGAWTEVHPPIAMASMRGTRQGKTFLRQEIAKHIPELQPGAKILHGVKVDVWINGDGGKAVEILDGLQAYDIRQVYEFEVPLPAPPSPLHPRAKFHVKSLRLAAGQPAPQITRQKTASGESLEVRIDLTGYQDTWNTCRKEGLTNCAGDAYGVTIVAGWEGFAYPTDLRRIQMTFTEVNVFDDLEGEDGDGEFNLNLNLGPSTALGGDVLAQSSSIDLQEYNWDLLDAAGDGEGYPLRKQGNAPRFWFNVFDNPAASEKNFCGFRLGGYEDDPVWDDELVEMERTFYAATNIWREGFPPKWAGCGVLGGPKCDYGQEIFFGTVRGKAATPILYQDGVRHPDSRTVGEISHSLSYSAADTALPP